MCLQRTNAVTEVHFINVGYGDASLIIKKEPGGRQFCMLVDCGGETKGDGDTAGLRVAAWEYIRRLGIEKIDVVLLTHLHLDHTGGLLEIARNFAVDELWTGYVPESAYWGKPVKAAAELAAGPQNLVKSLRLYTAALTVFAAKGTRIRKILPGFSPECPLGEMRVLTGDPALLARQSQILDDTFARGADNGLLCELDGFINNTSLRLRFYEQNSVFLFAGDIYAREWEKEQIEPADVVKVPHHGHADSMNAAIAKKLKAKYAVISVSNTREDCPNPQVVCILERAGAHVLFTDAVKTPIGQMAPAHSAIVFRLDGGGLHPVFYIKS